MKLKNWAVILPIVLCICSVLLRANAQEGEQPETHKVESEFFHVWATPVVPFDFESAKVKFTYSYVGGDKSKEVRFNLPDDKLMFAFRRLNLTVDGQTPPYINDSLDRYNFAFPRGVVLRPGEQVDLIIPLDKIYKLPKSWKSLEVVPGKINRIPGTVQSFKIVRYFSVQQKEVNK